MVQFSSRDDCLQIGGMSLTRLVQRVGRTPFYAYDRQRITDRIALLRQHLPAEVHLHYAMKANPMPAVVQHMAGLVDGLDVASAGEMKIALDTPMPPCQVSFAGPGKADQELSCAIAAGIIVNMESEQEMERIANLGNHLGIRPKVAVRVNPDFELKSSSMKMGGGAKPFGVDAERVPAMLARMAKLELDFEGFHIFSGSQNLKVAAIQESHEKTLQLGIALARHAPGPVRLLNIGGGFGVPYFPGDEPLDVAAVGENLRHLMPEARRQLPDAQVVIELGTLSDSGGRHLCMPCTGAKRIERTNIPGNGWWIAPSSCGFRKFWPGYPQELSCGRRQQDK